MTDAQATRSHQTAAAAHLSSALSAQHLAIAAHDKLPVNAGQPAPLFWRDGGSGGGERAQDVRPVDYDLGVGRGCYCVGGGGWRGLVGGVAAAVAGEFEGFEFVEGLCAVFGGGGGFGVRRRGCVGKLEEVAVAVAAAAKIATVGSSSGFTPATLSVLSPSFVVSCLPQQIVYGLQVRIINHRL